MKSFKKHISEVAEPKSPEEKAFKDQHVVDTTPHPVAPESQHKGTIKPKARRRADQEGDANYDLAYESVEQVDEVLKPTDDMGTWIKDFKDSDAPQFAGKSMKKRAQMAIAAKLGAERDAGMREEVELDEAAFAPTMKKAIAAHERGDHKMAKYHLDNAKTARYAMKSTDVSKHKELLDKYKELRSMHEDVEQIDELSKSTLGSYADKAKKSADKHLAIARAAWKRGDKETDDKHFSKGAARAFKASVAQMKANVKEETEQLDELNKSTLGSYVKKAQRDVGRSASSAMLHKQLAKDGDSTQDKYAKDATKDMVKRRKGIDKAVDRLTKEEVELEKLTLEELDDFIMSEEFEQLDEISKDLVTRYKDKATSDLVRRAANVAVDKRDAAKHRTLAQRIRSRHRIVGLPRDDKKVKKEVEAHNKPARKGEAAVKHNMDKIDKRAQGIQRAKMRAEEVELDEKLHPNQKKIDANKNGKIDAHDFALLRAKKKNEEVELDELNKSTLQSYKAQATGQGMAHSFAAQDAKDSNKADMHAKKAQKRMVGAAKASKRLGEDSELDETTASATKKPVNVTGPDGKTRTVMRTTKTNRTDQYGQDEIKANESVEYIEETFKQGIVKLQDGSSLVLKKEDADMLNNMMKKMSSGSRSKMESIAMRDKKGFSEILDFAKEAQ